MKLTKYLLILMAAISCCGHYVYAYDFQNESLRYVISYKWGLIHKDAGDAVLSLKSSGNNYQAVLTAKTKPWADAFYSVRDTLRATMRKHDLRPSLYEKINHEKGKLASDIITYSYSPPVVTGHVKRIREKDNRLYDSTRELTAPEGPVFDMLSVFYYLRTLDYRKLAEGGVETAKIFSGSKVETLTIKCLGKERIQLRDKTHREAYHIQFSFTHDGKKKSSDDMNCWISTDNRHIPLYVVGKLPVGEVRVYYMGG